ncbi:MAG TPA: hypothetical protein VIV58_23165 [Kofleriaceae bacterium]
MSPAPFDSGSHALRQAVCHGAQRLVDVQADITGDNAHNGLVDADPDDGGWDWTLAVGATTHTPAASPENLYGGTGFGLWAARTSGCDSLRLFEGALDTGLGMQQRAAVDSPPDFVFGIRLAELAENPGFAELARERYDAKVAAVGGATALATQIRDARHAGGDNALVPYDLGWLVISAAALDGAFPNAGYHADADIYASIADAALAAPYFDLDDASQPFYITGVAWAQVVAARAGDHAAFTHARTRLLATQLADGSWFSDSTVSAGDLQATAHALQTIALTTTRHARSAVRRGAHWLLQAQSSSGAWNDPGNTETPLVEGDILLGLVLSQNELDDDALAPATRVAAQDHEPRASAAPLP